VERSYSQDIQREAPVMLGDVPLWMAGSARLSPALGGGL
jgi:hypothetical protein